MVNRDEIINGVLLILIGGLVWWQSGSFPTLEKGYPGPSLFPRIISAGLILTGGLLLFSRALKTADSTPAEKQWLKLFGGLGLVAIYPILHPHLGFLPTLGMVCLGMGFLLGVKPWIAVVSALGTVLFIFLTFEQLLGVSL